VTTRIFSDEPACQGRPHDVTDGDRTTSASRTNAVTVPFMVTPRFPYGGGAARPWRRACVAAVAALTGPDVALPAHRATKDALCLGYGDLVSAILVNDDLFILRPRECRRAEPMHHRKCWALKKSEHNSAREIGRQNSNNDQDET
jgi:hypothetical protein